MTSQSIAKNHVKAVHAKNLTFLQTALQFWYNNMILLFDKDDYEKLPLIIFDFNWFVRCALIICKAYQSWHFGATPCAMICLTTNYVLWK